MDGSTYQHDFALHMAWEQQVAKYGVENVYADYDGLRGPVGGLLKYVTHWSDIANPDLVAFGATTHRGVGFEIWDVKPASAYGRSIERSVNYLGGYVTGLMNLLDYPVMRGGPIIPESRPYAGPDAQGLMLIFNGSDWERLKIPVATPTHRYPAEDIASLDQTPGLIYYRLISRDDKKKRELNKTEAAKEMFAHEVKITICQPPVIDLHAPGSPRAVGELGAPGLEAQRLIQQTALPPSRSGPLRVFNPNPYPAPVIYRFPQGGGGWSGDLGHFDGLGFNLKDIFIDMAIMTGGALLLSRIPGGLFITRGGASVATRVGAPAAAEAAPWYAGMVKGMFGLAA
ncbi:hypothetical protein [Catellatospora sp. NPDC049133]|uniref:hypothetical protein n=1 Tax=Catellatospora sp. NPDC049133 TaxID=3155499 RepID=UPI003403BD80